MKKLPPFLLLMAWFTVLLPIHAQSPTPTWLCGAPVQPFKDAALQRQHEAIEQQIYQFLAQPKRRSPLTDYTLPVVIHIVENGTTLISDADVNQGIQNLNDAFANRGYYNPATGADTRIQFCIARRTPNNTATTGITRLTSPLTNMVMETEDLNLKALRQWNPTQYINIWLVNEVTSATQGSGVVGYAYFPSSHGRSEDGIVMEARYFAASPAHSSVLAHEMGHFLGLYHTFQGGCTNNNCLTDGDKVCDTPPDQVVHAACHQNVNSCTSDSDDSNVRNPFRISALGGLGDQSDRGENYMDYSPLNCYSDFTEGQAVRMRWHIQKVRQSLLQSLACQDPCLLPPVTAAITPRPTSVIVGNALNFTANTTNATLISWNIGNSTYSANNISHLFSQVGTVRVRLMASNQSALCQNAFDSIDVRVLCDIRADFTHQLSGSALQFTNNSTNGTNYEWYVSTNGTRTLFATTPNATYTPADLNQAYTICLKATNPNCSDSLCKVIVPNPSNASNSNLKTILIGDAQTNNAGHVIPDGQGNYFLTCGTFDNVNYTPCVTKIDGCGRVLWSKNYFSGVYAGLGRGYLMNDGNLIVHGQSGYGSENKYVLKLDANTGAILWSKAFVNTQRSIAAPFCRSEGDAAGETYYFAHWYPGGGDDLMRITKLNAAGTVIWQKSYSVNTDDQLYEMQAMPDGGVMLLGESIVSGVRRSPLLMKVQADGTVSKSAYYQEASRAITFGTFTSAAASPDGGFLIGGVWYGNTDQPTITKLDANLNIQWQKRLNNTAGGSGHCKIFKDRFGSYYVYYYEWIDNQRRLAVHKLDAAAQPVWSKYFNTPTAYVNNYVFATCRSTNTTVENLLFLDIVAGSNTSWGGTGSDISLTITDTELNSCQTSRYTPNFITMDYSRNLVTPIVQDFSLSAGTETTISNASYQAKIGCGASCDTCQVRFTISPANPTTCDSVCFTVNRSCNFNNYHWGLCESNPVTQPTITHYAAPGGTLTGTKLFKNRMGQYFIFCTDYSTARIIRYDFGNSPNNTPTSTTFNLPATYTGTQQAQIDLIDYNGNYYGYFVAGSYVYRLDFGTNIQNTNPTITTIGGTTNAFGWGHSLEMTYQDGTWWAIIASRHQRLAILNFGNNPLGAVQSFQNFNGGNANAQFTGATYIRQNGNHYILACDFINGLIRFNFGNSLTNTPVVTNLGFFGSGYQWTIRGYPQCDGSYIAFVMKENGGIGDDHKVIRFADLNGTPTIINTIHGLNQVANITTIHHADNLLYFFGTSGYGSRLSRVVFTECNTTGATGEQSFCTKYTQAGTYTVHLTVNEGLPNQASYCQTVQVRACADTCVTAVRTLNLQPKAITICSTGVKIFRAGGGFRKYRWQSGEWTTDSIFTATVSAVGTYWVKLEVQDSCGNLQRDSAQMTVVAPPQLNLNSPLRICSGDSVRLTAPNGYTIYGWYPSNGLNDSTVQNPIAKPMVTTKYYLSVVTSLGCLAADSILVNVSGKDSTYLTQNSCNPRDTGLIINRLRNRWGCDSLVWIRTTLLPSDSISIARTSCNPRDTGLIVTHFQNRFGCDSAVWIRTTLLPSDSISIARTSCNPQDTGLIINRFRNRWGCDSLIFIRTNLSRRDSIIIDTNICVGQRVRFGDSTLQQAGNYKILLINQFGCDSILMIRLRTQQILQVRATATTNFNGFPIRCFNHNDGAAQVTISGTNRPYSIIWRDSSRTLSNQTTVQDLKAGKYFVMVRDSNNCVGIDSIVLQEPSPVRISATVNAPHCHNGRDGSVILKNLTGGIPPFQVKLDPFSFQTTIFPHTISGLASGMAHLRVQDKNNCITEAPIWIANPAPITLQLTADKTLLFLGDSAQLTATVQGLRQGSLRQISWQPSKWFDSINPLVINAKPIQNTFYEVTVTDTFGCKGQQQILIQVDKTAGIYIPTAFRPNGRNHLFSVYAGGQVQKIVLMQIFDQWGNMVYEALNFKADGQTGWDGTFNGQLMNSANFICKVQVKMADGTEKIVTSGFTLIQ